MISSNPSFPMRQGALFTVPRRLCLNAQGAVVEADDPAAVELLAPEGAVLPHYRAVELGLVSDEETDQTPDTQTQTVETQNGEAKAKIATK